MTIKQIPFLSSLFLILFLTNCKKTDSSTTETMPTACLSVSKNNVVVGETFTAYNCSTNGSTFQWEDGDGTVSQASSTAPRTGIFYNNPGTYTLKLTAYSPNKTKQNSTTTTINVIPNIGNAMVWTSKSNAGPISVKVNNISVGTITSWYSSSPSNCGAAGCVTFQNVPGIYAIYATDGTNVWNSNVTIQAGGCFKLQLQ
jgi:hypothetical protein